MKRRDTVTLDKLKKKKTKVPNANGLRFQEDAGSQEEDDYDDPSSSNRAATVPSNRTTPEIRSHTSKKTSSKPILSGKTSPMMELAMLRNIDPA